MTEATGCRSCAAGSPKRGVRVCPECGYVFRGEGWEGIEAHWRSKHDAIESYESFFARLCREHRRPKTPLVASSQSDLKNEGRTLTRFFAGKVIRAIHRHDRTKLVIDFTDGSRFIVDDEPEGLEFSIQE